jgi:phosphoglycolate phosphatase-like HAD superfamily hydrolase
VVFDLDQTLVDSSSALEARSRRNWPGVYRLIPGFDVYPGVDDVLQWIRDQSLTIFIVTSAPRPYCEKVVSHFEFPVDGMVCYHDTRRRKPHPDPFLLALKRMGLAAGEVPSFGDQPDDIIASHAAGMPAYACDWGAEDIEALVQSGPVESLESASEIPGLLGGKS